MTGHTIKSTYGKHIDYSKYLGPDWKPDWDDAPIAIGGPHTSWLDVALAAYIYFPSFVARFSVKKMFAINVISDSLNCIYIDRFSKNSKDHQEVKDKINQYVKEHENGKYKYPLLIFPEGCVHNGKQLVQFKVGAFANLNAVMPFSLKIDRGPYGVSSDLVNE